MATTALAKNETAAIQEKPKTIVELVATQINALIDTGGLHLPEDYSVSNALKSAWLVLQGTSDRNGKPVLEACSKKSIAEALLDMAVQALNPGKRQCYFIAYGKELACQRSYFGDEAVAKRVLAGQGYESPEIFAEVIYKGDTLSYKIERGQRMITGHEQALGNISTNLDDIEGAYCVVYHAGSQRPLMTLIRTLDQIKASWKASKTWKPGKPGTFHEDTPDIACKRTVIRRACTEIFNASNDAYLRESIGRQAVLEARGEMDAEVAENAGATVIALPPKSPKPEATKAARKPEREAPPTASARLDLLRQMAADTGSKISTWVENLTGEVRPLSELTPEQLDKLEAQLAEELAIQDKQSSGRLPGME